MVKQDPHSAVEHFVKGAAKNNAFCYFMLSDLYSNGKFFPAND